MRLLKPHRTWVTWEKLSKCSKYTGVALYISNYFANLSDKEPQILNSLFAIFNLQSNCLPVNFPAHVNPESRPDPPALLKLA